MNDEIAFSTPPTIAEFTAHIRRMLRRLNLGDELEQLTEQAETVIKRLPTLPYADAVKEYRIIARALLDASEAAIASGQAEYAAMKDLDRMLHPVWTEHPDWTIWQCIDYLCANASALKEPAPDSTLVARAPPGTQ